MRRLTGVLVVLTAACATGTEPESRLNVQVVVSRTQVLPGDTLSITVTASNPTDQPVRLPQSPCMPLMYRVYGSDGTRLAPPPNLRCALVGGNADWVVKPGASQSVTHR